MRKLYIFAAILIICLALSPLAFGEDETPAPGAGEQKEATEEQSGQAPMSSATQQIIPWGAMNEMQIALMIINKQFDYLMNRVEDSDRRVEQLMDSFEERLKRETDRIKEQVADYEVKTAAQNEEMKAYREQIAKLERDMALFASQSGLYLLILIGFLAGALAGVVLSAIMSSIKRRGNVTKQG
ncbi:MAG: hypothetical protein AB1420_02730 [Bacillota bacterium]